jgi:predicted nucleotidyltransferase
MNDATVAAIQSFLEERFDLDALWEFGSRAEDRARADSDLDLAALFARSPSAAELLDARERLASLVGIDVDLVDLERASPVLAMQVLRKGRLLVDNHPYHRIHFTAGAPLRYEDLKIMRREAERAVLERVRTARP